MGAPASACVEPCSEGENKHARVSASRMPYSLKHVCVSALRCCFRCGTWMSSASCSSRAMISKTSRHHRLLLSWPPSPCPWCTQKENNTTKNKSAAISGADVLAYITIGTGVAYSVISVLTSGIMLPGACLQSSSKTFLRDAGPWPLLEQR